MATQHAVVPTYPQSDQRKPLPRHLQRAYKLRNAVYRQLDAIEGAEFESLFRALSNYLRVPAEERNALDRWTYPT